MTTLPDITPEELHKIIKTRLPEVLLTSTRQEDHYYQLGRNWNLLSFYEDTGNLYTTRDTNNHDETGFFMALAMLPPGMVDPQR